MSDVENALVCATAVSASSSNTAVLPNGNITIAGTAPNCTVSMNPAANQNGASTVTLTVSDGTLSAQDTFVLTINAVNDAPTMAAITDQSTNEDTAATAISLTVSDVDGPAQTCNAPYLSYTSATASVVAATGAVTWGGSWPNCTAVITPVANASGTSVIQITANDGTLTSSPQSFTLTVNAVNDVPAISTISPQITNEDGPMGVSFTASDVDGALSCSGTHLSYNSSVPSKVAASGALVWSGTWPNCIGTMTPVANANDSAEITFNISDGLLTASQTFSLTLTPVNDAPVISDITNQVTAEDTNLTDVALSMSDVDHVLSCATSLTASSSNTTLLPVANITFGGTAPNCTVNMAPALNQNGTSSVTLTVTDGTLTAQDSFLLTVSSVNNAPSIAAISNISTNEDTSTTALAVTVSDVDGPAQICNAPYLSYTSATASVVAGSGAVTWGGSWPNCTAVITPVANASGTSVIQITANDGTLTSSPQSFTLTVNAVNDAPSAAAISDLSTNQDVSTSAISVTVSDVDGPAQICNATFLSYTSATASVVAATGALTWGGTWPNCTAVIAPVANASGTSVIEITANDGNLFSSAQSFTLEVIGGGAPPSPVLSSLSVLKTLHQELTGTCDSNPLFVTTAVTTLGRIQSVSCVANVLNVKITDLPDGRGSFTVTVTTTRTSNSSNSSSSTNYTYQFFCPKNYVGIPGKFSTDADFAGLGNPSASSGNADGGLDPGRDFCVMKYQAKAATSNGGGQTPFEPVYDGNKTFTPMTNYWPESRADSTPWVNISRDEADLRCRALNETLGNCIGSGCDLWDNQSYGYRLMSNTQWQVAARNLENNGGNWTSGTVGSGYLWRGHSDYGIGADTDLHTQTYSGFTELSLSNPRSDSGNSDYFGTGNTVTQNTSGESGWQERRRFVVSNGRSIWDFAGNVWQWVSDDNATLSKSPATDSYSGEYSNETYFPITGVDSFKNRLNFAPGGSYNSTQNAGRFHGGSADAVLRGGDWGSASSAGLFAVYNIPAGHNWGNIGFRCAFLPPLPPPSPLDTGSPIVTPQRVDSSGSGVANTAVTVGAGGIWNLGITVTDAENTGSNANKIYVEVRRKVSASPSDFPTSSDPVYQGGYNLTSLPNETAWVQDPATGQYTRNDGMYVHYLVRAQDPSGNVGSSNFSVTNTKSCPPGYVGVPGSATTGLGSPLATVGNTNKSLDPSLDFCVMKYPAKVMSAGTSSAQSTVGGLFEPIINGASIFTNDYTYTDAASFHNKIIYLPESRSSGTPWVNINRDDSIKACQAQQLQYFGTMPDSTNGGGFQLISNTQWQVVARNAEAVGSNWSGNAVGSGVLNRGHSDNTISATEVLNSWCFGCTSPSTSLSGAPNSVSDNNGYFATGAGTTYAAWNTLGTSPTAGSEQKRTYLLSNGRLIWDFGGNVWQWVSDNYSTLSMAPEIIAAWSEFSNTTRFPVSGVNRLNFAPSGSYNSVQNAGKLSGGYSGAVLRGGGWSGTSSGGLFSADLAAGPTYYYNLGFRCVYNPPPNTGIVSGMAPEIKALGRVTDLDDFMENSAVTVANGGSWNLKWAVSDAETATSSLTVEVRRKIASTASDFPIASDAVYATGNGSTLTKLTGETAWESPSVTNNSKFVNYLITVVDAAGNSTSQTFSVTNTSSCPSGYVGVPGNSTAGLGSPLATIGNTTGSLDPSRAFCVMKYPAKNVSSVATSVAAGTPWVDITRDTAATTCSSLGAGFGLISNTQWQVVARNAENVASNWSGGAVGTGVLNRGHSDNSPASALANTADDTDGYFGTGITGLTSQAWSGLGATPAAGGEQKRTFNLSNGKVVWDFGGNVWQWVSDNYWTLSMSPAIGAGWSEYSNTTNFPITGVDSFKNRLNFAPSGSYNSVQNAGQLYGGSAGAVSRGGFWNSTSVGGLFSARLSGVLTSAGLNLGFRCAFLP